MKATLVFQIRTYACRKTLCLGYSQMYVFDELYLHSTHTQYSIYLNRTQYSYTPTWGHWEELRVGQMEHFSTPWYSAVPEHICPCIISLTSLYGLFISLRLLVNYAHMALLVQDSTQTKEDSKLLVTYKMQLLGGWTRNLRFAAKTTNLSEL